MYSLSRRFNYEVCNVAVSAGQITYGNLKEQKSASTLNTTLQSSISDYEDIYRKEIQKIRQHILADLAYVELEPLKALSTAKTLPNIVECSKIYLFLGNVYAAKALCLLNRSKEAAEHLLIFLSSGNNVELSLTEEDCEHSKNMDPEESNGGSVAAYNSAVKHKISRSIPKRHVNSLQGNSLRKFSCHVCRVILSKQVDL